MEENTRKSASVMRSGVTVVIPVRNRLALASETMASIAAQKRLPEAVVMVDNGSTDGTPTELRRWAGILQDKGVDARVLVNDILGANYARNTGLEAVETEWVMFFDSDDLMHPDHIANAMAALERNPLADIIGWDVDYVNLRGRRSRKPFEVHDASYHNLFHGNLSTQRYMARTQLVRQVGGWNTHIREWDDIELGARLLVTNPVLVKARRRTRRPTVTVRAQEQSITGIMWGPDISRYMPALVAMRMTLPPEQKNWIEFRCLLVGALIASENSPRGPEIKRRLLAFTPTSGRRRLMHLAYIYTRLGGRGIARLAKPLLCR